ncbi:unnamed protein product [Lactuca virosa]|uniref:Uncharacterized protein n=1 Tax=Lactuca virosa TaxID=75947 RepID=A0AAU9NNL6_9ASTR|nr:unnamed protein product [Lactuca virosa]
MVLEVQRYPSGYQQNNYPTHQGPDGYFSNFQGMTATQTTPYPTYPQVSTYPSSHVSQYQSSWSAGDEYQHGNGPSHPVKPSAGGYGGNSHGYGKSHGYENSFSHGSQQAHGSPHGHGHGSPNGLGKSHGYENSFSHGSQQGHGSPNGHGLGSPHGLGKPHGYGDSQSHGNSHGFGNSNGHGGGVMNHFEKLTHGHGYGAPGPNYGHAPSGMNHGYQKPSWTMKGLEDDE